MSTDREKGRKTQEPKKKKGEINPTGMSPRNREACHSIGTSLRQSIAKIGTQSTMKSKRKTWKEFPPNNIPQTPSEGNRSRSTNKTMHA
jgi:hypothetical protein